MPRICFNMPIFRAAPLWHKQINRIHNFLRVCTHHNCAGLFWKFAGERVKDGFLSVKKKKKKMKNVMRDKTFCHMNAFYKLPDEKPWKDQCWDVVLAVSNVRWRRSYDIEGLTYWATILKHIHWWFVIKAWYMQGNR